MSRIGKKPVTIPAGVNITLDGQTVTVKGPKGQLSWTVVDEIEVTQEGGELNLTPRSDSTRARSMWGLSRTLVNNMVVGVTAGYEEVLELAGVRYRAAMKGNALSMELGFSHEIIATVTSHSPKMPFRVKSAAGHVLHHADMFSADHAYMALGMTPTFVKSH